MIRLFDAAAVASSSRQTCEIDEFRAEHGDERLRRLDAAVVVSRQSAAGADLLRVDPSVLAGGRQRGGERLDERRVLARVRDDRLARHRTRSAVQDGRLVVLGDRPVDPAARTGLRRYAAYGEFKGTAVTPTTTSSTCSSSCLCAASGDGIPRRCVGGRRFVPSD